MEVIQAGSIFIVSVVSLSLCALQKQCALRNPVWSGLRTNLSTVTGEPTQKLGAPPKSICTICPFVYFFFFFFFTALLINPLVTNRQFTEITVLFYMKWKSHTSSAVHTIHGFPLFAVFQPSESCCEPFLSERVGLTRYLNWSFP